jgi:hypothetical protein
VYRDHSQNRNLSLFRLGVELGVYPDLKTAYDDLKRGR